jgi:heterotetrameric sarcosine oxidase gamma subunit
MTEYNPIFRSPIAVPEQPSTSQNLRLSDLTGLPVIQIKGNADNVLKKQFGEVPAQPGGLVDVGDGFLARLTPQEFYLFGKTAASKLPAAVALDDSFARAKCFAHATDLTHGRAVLYLVGTDAPEMLSKICGLDFHNTVFPNLQVAQTSAAKIKTLIARYDEGETPAYFLHVNRPFGQYFWNIVWDAGQEFGIASIGAGT